MKISLLYRRLYWCVLGLVVVLTALSVAFALAHASGMMGVGTMLQGAGAGSGPPPETFYLTTDSGSILTNDAGTDRITTQ